MDQERTTSCTFICSRDTLDGAIPPLILATNARRLGMESTVFFTFMGVKVVKRGGVKHCRFLPPGFLGAIPGMSFIATKMMERKMDAAGIPSLAELLEMAQLEGVRYVVCKMTADMMELNREDFIEGVEIQTAEDYLKYARRSQINMFI